MDAKEVFVVLVRVNNAITWPLKASSSRLLLGSVSLPVSRPVKYIPLVLVHKHSSYVSTSSVGKTGQAVGELRDHHRSNAKKTDNRRIQVQINQQRGISWWEIRVSIHLSIR